MGLLASDRHTAADLAHWRIQERMDRRLADTTELARAVDRSRARIEAFAGRGPCHVACSWGRDSVVVTHLAHGLGLPVVWAVIGPDHRWEHKQRLDNPDCPAVRDAYLTQWPAAEYLELPFGTRHTARGPVEVWPCTPAETSAWGEGHAVTGIRADESRARGLSQRAHGHTTSRTCRPIIDWPSRLVWAYLARHDLPIHPAYAMTFGGVLPRDRVRVHSLGGSDGSGHGRWEWENAYYPEALQVRDWRAITR